jgi:tetratricopeptide (TPR) repeat protein
MGSIKKRFFFRVFFLFLLLPSGGVYIYGQSASGGSALAATEIQSLEKKLTDRGISAAERHGALIRLARLFRLSGDLESAARFWTEAAFVEPDNRDDRALLEAARCSAAIGELDKAEAGVQRVLLTGRDPGIIRHARYLAAQIKTFRSGDISALAALVEEPGYSEYKAALYYTQWKISGDSRYKSRLLAEYPESPEARIAGSGGGAVSAVPQALWFLFPGRDAVTLAPPAAGESPRVSLSPADQNPQVRETTGGTAPVVLQTGLFRREENARALAERHKRAGFQADITRRRVKGTDYWVVTVPAGNDMGRTLIQLKDAGFESFPVFQ